MKWRNFTFERLHFILNWPFAFYQWIFTVLSSVKFFIHPEWTMNIVGVQ